MASRAGLRLLAAEHRALLLAVDGGEGGAELVAALRGVDWDALLALAARERAGAELYRRVRQLPPTDAPPEALVALRRLAMISDFEMLQAEQCLTEVLRVAESLDVRVMLLKGAAIAHTLYGGELRRRPMSDIDLLVDPSRAAVLQRALMAGAWQREGSADTEAVYLEHHHLPPLRDARGSAVVIEIHTGLFPPGSPFPLTPELLWSAAVPVSAANASAPIRAAYVPSVPHQLVYLCLHFAWSHAMKFGAWRAFRDLSAIAMAGVDWDAFVRDAREMRAATSCYWTLRLACAAAGIPVPAEVGHALRPPRPEAYLRGLERHYLLNLFPTGQVCPSVRLDRTLWDLGILPAWSGHGDARPWDQDARFLAAKRASPAPARAGRVQRLWRTTRYLGNVMGLEALSEPAQGTRITRSERPGPTPLTSS